MTYIERHLGVHLKRAVVHEKSGHKTHLVWWIIEWCGFFVWYMVIVQFEGFPVGDVSALGVGTDPEVVPQDELLFWLAAGIHS